MIGIVHGQPTGVISTLDGGRRRRTGTALPPVIADRCQIWFDDPDDADLVAAAIHRYLQADVVAGLALIPTDHGPALELPMSAMSLRLVRSLVRRFEGRVERPPVVEAPTS
jgi:hypothetical protein